MSENLYCEFCKGYSIAAKYNFDSSSIFKCNDCGLMFLHPIPSILELKKIYNGKYFENETLLSPEMKYLYGYYDYISERLNKQYGYQGIIKSVRELLPTKAHKPRWLDIGCGYGYLMDIVFDNGFEVTGVEFNPYAAKYIKSKYVYPVIEGTIKSIPKDKKFEVISMMDVIEHLRNPFEDLNMIRDLLVENGLIVITTMDSESLTSRILGKKLEDFRRTREHIFFFSRRSMRAVLKQHGYEILKMRSIGHTFQLKFLFERIGNYFPRISKVIKFFIFPKWLLEANVYINPGTKMLLIAVKSKKMKAHSS